MHKYMKRCMECGISSKMTKLVKSKFEGKFICENCSPIESHKNHMHFKNGDCVTDGKNFAFVTPCDICHRTDCNCDFQYQEYMENNL
jgi:hypothetical protein